MKITIEGVTRVLDLERNITFRQSIAIQDFSGLTVLGWQQRLADMGGASEADYKADPRGTLAKMPMFSDPAWINGMAAAHWLMFVQAGEDVPPLDDDYDCDVIGFVLAFYTAAMEEVKAKRVPDKPDPTGRPGRRAPSSRRTARPKTAPGSVPPLTAMPPPTGS